MTNRLEDEIQRIVQRMDNENEQREETPAPKQDEEEIHDIYVLIVREREEEEDQAHVVDIEPAIPQPPPPQPFDYVTPCIVLICCLPILASIMLQVYMFLNPPIATVTIVPKSQTVTLTGTLQLGRLLNPITISQSQTVSTTGKGHQDARSATGYITFYNGQLNSIIVAAGTILTATNGAQIITEQDALIPQASPPIEGQITVSADATTTGTQGNIPTKAINEPCCDVSVLAVNLTPFSGGQDERTFQTVTKSDIENTAQPLKTTLSHSTAGALQGQLNPNEQLYLLPCTSTVTADHRAGAEATRVTVTVSETCSAVAYGVQAVAEKAKDVLYSHAVKLVHAGYSLLGTVQVSVKQASVTTIPRPLVFLSFHAQGMWVYALSTAAQQHINSLIAGKTKQEALQLLASLPGVEHASIRWDGFGDSTRVPKETRTIHFHIIIQSS